MRAGWRLASLTLGALLLGGCSTGSGAAPTTGSASPAARPAAAEASAPAASAAEASPSRAAPERISFGVAAVSGVFIPHLIAQEKGFLAEEGLETEVAVIRSNLLASGMASGELDYAGSFSPSVRNALAGHPLRVVAATVNKSTRQIFVGPGITSIEQMRGKAVAITTLGDGPHNSGVLAFEAVGIDPNTEITWLAVGPGIERFAAVQQGVAQASILTGAEAVRADSFGMTPLLRLDEVAPLPESGVATSAAKLQSNRDQVKRVLRAMVRSLQYVKTDRAGTLPTFTRFLGLSPEEAGPSYDAIVHAFSDDGTLSERSMQFTIAAERKHLNMPADAPAPPVSDYGPLYEVLGELGITPPADAAR